ncbi:MAG: hypothetical protein CMN34_03265 [Saprospirales bacterium]|nr:hypothetical protein [Saprospirales bacterium]
MIFLLKYLHPMRSLNHSLLFSFFFSVVGLVWVAGWLHAQDQETSSSILSKQDKLRNDLANLEGDIQRLESQQQVTINQLRLLNIQRQIQDSLVNLLRQDSVQLAYSLDSLQEEEGKTRDEYERLKGNCADAVRMAYRYRVSQSRSMYVLSSTSFEDVFQRYRFMGNLSRVLNYKMRAVQEIQDYLVFVQNEVKAKITVLEFKKAELLEEQRALRASEDQYNAILLSLENDMVRQQQIKSEIQANISALDLRLKEILEEEARMEQERKASLTKPDPADVQLANSFAANKGRFEWPVNNGRIVTRFGQVSHPDMPSILIQNNGLDIETTPNAEVRVLYKGKVSRVFEMTNVHWTVIVQHGPYFTVYSNLSRPVVSRGQSLSSGQVIGSIYSEGLGALSPRIHLEIWKNSVKLNPEVWIR